MADYEYEDTPMGRCLKVKTPFVEFMTTRDRPKFESLYDGLHIAGPFSNEEFEYFLFIRIYDWEDLTGERFRDGNGTEWPFLGEIVVVAPDQVSGKHLRAALDSCGYVDNPPEGLDLSALRVQAELLLQYGICAVAFSKPGTDEDELLDALTVHARAVESMFGFYMDRQMNAFGATGWDFLRGNLGI